MCSNVNGTPSAQILKGAPLRTLVELEVKYEFVIACRFDSQEKICFYLLILIDANIRVTDQTTDSICSNNVEDKPIINCQWKYAFLYVHKRITFIQKYITYSFKNYLMTNKSLEGEVYCRTNNYDYDKFPINIPTRISIKSVDSLHASVITAYSNIYKNYMHINISPINIP